MAMSGPRGTHSHDEDEAPAVFADINITPLTDIFLVLLIIFMVTTTAAVEAGGQGNPGAGVRVNLPRGSARELTAAQKDFPVAIMKDGSTVAEGKLVDGDKLRERFKLLLKDNPDVQVVIQADTGVAHGRVVEVMEVAKSSGISNLAIATEAEGSK